MVILGISAFFHDSAAAILIDGRIVAAAQEERFTRIKQDASFPTEAVKYVLEEAGLGMEDVDVVSFYDKPYLKFERLLETYHAFAPAGWTSFLASMPIWVKEKIFLKDLIRKELKKLGKNKAKLHFPEHHLSHAASAFYPSPFEEAVILTLDGVGEWATTSICHGKGSDITVVSELQFPHSIGLLYSAFTYYTGFRVNSGEYKLMGLAPYGLLNSERFNTIKKKILDTLIDLREDGSMALNMRYFRYATGDRMTHDGRWTELFGFPPRKPESPLTQEYMDMALAIQKVTEEIVVRLARTAKEVTGCENLVMAGGVALNSVANGVLLNENIYKEIWIQPAAGDAGGALGAALASLYIWQGEKRVPTRPDAMQGSYLGPAYGEREILEVMRKYGAPATKMKSDDELCHFVSGEIENAKVVGWFQGRMEYGPRALGARSILADARNREMQLKLNLKIKKREGFRPFAPSVMEEEYTEHFDLNVPSPYMLNVIPVKEEKRLPIPEGTENLSATERVKQVRSDLPAITHMDYSARVQTVSKDTNPKYWKLLSEIKKRTGYGLVVNTSFNLRGEPMVCTPQDAYRCFMRTDMDVLVLENFVFQKTEQPEWTEDGDTKELFAPD